MGQPARLYQSGHKHTAMVRVACLQAPRATRKAAARLPAPLPTHLGRGWPAAAGWGLAAHQPSAASAPAATGAEGNPVLLHARARSPDSKAGAQRDLRAHPVAHSTGPAHLGCVRRVALLLLPGQARRRRRHDAPLPVSSAAAGGAAERRWVCQVPGAAGRGDTGSDVAHEKGGGGGGSAARTGLHPAGQRIPGAQVRGAQLVRAAPQLTRQQTRRNVPQRGAPHPRQPGCTASRSCPPRRGRQRRRCACTPGGRHSGQGPAWSLSQAQAARPAAQRRHACQACMATPAVGLLRT